MPRVKLLEREYRTRDLNAEIEKCKTLRGYDTDRALAQALHMSPSVWCRRRKDPESMTLKEFLAMCQVLKLPSEAVVAYLGIK